jgi:putative ABC transport system permease protein
LLGDIEEDRGGALSALWTAVVVTTRLRRDARVSLTPVSRQGGAMAGLGLDVITATRALRATPAFTAVAVAVLALGVGATTAIFSVADVSLLRPLPFDDSDGLIAVGEIDRDLPSLELGRVGAAAPQNYREWERRQTTLAGLGAAQNLRMFTAPGDGEPELVRGLRATASLFDLLRIRPALGSFFTSHHETPGQERVVVIGDGLWRRRFNADPAIVGKTVSFDSGAYEVLGVLPPGFKYPVQVAWLTDAVFPYPRVASQEMWDRTKVGRNYQLQVAGRLRDGVTIEQARQEFAHIEAGLVAAHPDWFEDVRMAMAPLHATVVGRTRNWMVMLLWAVGFVLLISCANVANLLLARAAARSREYTVRAALGASRWRLVRGALVESLMLSSAGLVVAVVLASWGVSVLSAAMPASIPRLGDLGLDGRVLTFAAVVSLLTGLACGVLPAWQLLRRPHGDALKDGGRGGTTSRARQRLRGGLVVVEVAFALMLVVGAGLFVSSFVRLLGVDLGMDIQNVIAVGVNPKLNTSDRTSFDRARERSVPLAEEVMARLRSTPGVVAVAAVGSGSPLSGSWRTNAITVAGKPEFSGDADQVQIKEVTPAYRDVLRLPLQRGRFVEPTDTAATPPVVVLNEEAAQRFFDGAEPIGQRVKLDDAERTVVGIVGNVRVRGPEEPIAPEAYLPLAQKPSLGTTVIVRTSGDADALVPAAKAAVLAVIPDVPVTPETLERSFSLMTAQRRFNMLLVGLFGALALLIAGVGIYGVMAFLVTQQTREIGVRMALGAVPAGVLAVILKRAGTYVFAGVAIGLMAAWWLSVSLEGFLFSVRGRDPWVFLVSACVLAGTGLIATVVPALRAARVDPIIALRAE